MQDSYILQPWQTLGEETIITNRWLTLTREVCRLPTGEIIDDYYVLKHPDIVMVFAVTRDEKVVVVEQYKHGIGEVCRGVSGDLIRRRWGDRRLDEIGLSAALGHLFAAPFHDTPHQKTSGQQ